MKNTPKNAGNAFVIVLILIALLAALTITLTRMGSTTQEVSQEQAQTIASQVLRQARSMTNAVDGLITKGCSLTELSFQNTVVTSGYGNAQTPADNSCKLFEAPGAGMAFPTPPPSSNDGSNWVFTGYHLFAGNGAERETGTCCATDNSSDLVMILPIVNLSVCQTLNYQLGISTALNQAPPTITRSVSTSSQQAFRAASTAPSNSNLSANTSYSASFRIQSTGSTDSSAPLWDKKAGCFEAAAGYKDWADAAQTGTGKYFFYQVLFER